MAKQVLLVDGMGCDHCVNAVIYAVRCVHKNADVKVNLNTKEVQIDCESIDLDAVKAAIEEEGYIIL